MQGDRGRCTGPSEKGGPLGPAEQTLRKLDTLNLTESQRRDAINYNVGQVIEFHRRARGGFKSGEQWGSGSAQLGKRRSG